MQQTWLQRIAAHPKYSNLIIRIRKSEHQSQQTRASKRWREDGEQIFVGTVPLSHINDNYNKGNKNRRSIEFSMEITLSKLPVQRFFTSQVNASEHSNRFPLPSQWVEHCKCMHKIKKHTNWDWDIGGEICNNVLCDEYVKRGSDIESKVVEGFHIERGLSIYDSRWCMQCSCFGSWSVRYWLGRDCCPFVVVSHCWCHHKRETVNEHDGEQAKGEITPMESIPSL